MQVTNEAIAKNLLMMGLSARTMLTVEQGAQAD